MCVTQGPKLTHLDIHAADQSRHNQCHYTCAMQNDYTWQACAWCLKSAMQMHMPKPCDRIDYLSGHICICGWLELGSSSMCKPELSPVT